MKVRALTVLTILGYGLVVGCDEGPTRGVPRTSEGSGGGTGTGGVVAGAGGGTGGVAIDAQSGGQGGDVGDSSEEGSGGNPGSGGSDDGDGCHPRVLVLLQRTGAMFELPSFEDSWWMAVTEALAGDTSDLLENYASQVDLSLSTFFVESGSGTCPQSATVEDLDQSSVGEFLDEQADAFAAATEAEIKVDGPLPEAIAAGVERLGSAGDRYILLVTTGFPDTCVAADAECLGEDAMAAVQVAHEAGVKTRLVYFLGNNASVAYPIGLANAGDGQPIADLGLYCDKGFEYSDTTVETPFGYAAGPSEVKAAFDEMLSAVAACE